MKIKSRFLGLLIAIAVICGSFAVVSSSFAVVVKSKPITITASVTPKAGGTIMPSGKVPVDYGTNFTFDIAPSDDYEIAGVTVDGKSQGAISQYTFTNVTAKHSITAKFRIVTHTITVTTGENVQISPSGIIKAKRGKKINFIIKPLSKDVEPMLLVDGAKIDLTKTKSSYKFTLTVTGNHAVLATITNPRSTLWLLARLQFLLAALPQFLFMPRIPKAIP